MGIENVYISIAESNSKDRTKILLGQFDRLLTQLDIGHRIHTEDNSNRWWPYGTAPERVRYLAEVRNKAMEPIQSPDDALRLPNTADFTKIVFINDIYFSWQSIVRLLATRTDGKDDLPGDYDLACAIDYGNSGEFACLIAHAWVELTMHGQGFTIPGSRDRDAAFLCVLYGHMCRTRRV